jgi:hypothetical protein
LIVVTSPEALHQSYDQTVQKFMEKSSKMADNEWCWVHFDQKLQEYQVKHG